MEQQTVEFQLERFRGLVLDIKANPACWDQSTWHCGSSHCLAGLAQIKMGNAPDSDTASKDGQAYLGLGDGEAAYLFAGSRTLEDFERIAATGQIFEVATSGDGGTSTSGDGGTSTSGDRGTSTSGDGGTSTSGDGGASQAGIGGVIAISYWNGKRYKVRIGHVKDEDGDGDLEPNTKYRLNDANEFVEVV